MTKTRIAALVLAAVAVPAAAYHRQTPPIVAITFSGDTPLPRVPSAGRRIALALDSSGRQIFRLDRSRNILEQITTSGNNDNPTISASGAVVAWDADCTALGCPQPGRQIFMWSKGTSFQVTQDTTGTSVNPALSGKGNKIAFESRGNLIGNGNTTKQIFLRDAHALLSQISSGNGSSQNAALDRSGLRLVYDSTSTASGAASTVAQVWLLGPQSPGDDPEPITNGDGSSQRPSISPDGRIVVFDSSADLTGDRHDTGITQIFVYELRTRTITQVTNDTQGCTNASVSPMPGDYRIGYVCHDEGYFHQLRTNLSFRLPIPGTTTPQAIAELGGHFMVVSTKANLFGSGTTPGHQIYLLNLFKLAAEPL
ncbi:MAG TPA: hypothetical protein VKA21_10650 [Candidatus Binatia bacterium]|nr:hypothetical protein [Candidatus Binatia bacterium]